MRLKLGLLLLLIMVLCFSGGLWMASSPDPDNPPLPALILLLTGLAIFFVMVVVFWVGVLYCALTGKDLEDIRGPFFLAAFFTALGGGADGGGDSGGGGDFGGGA